MNYFFSFFSNNDEKINTSDPIKFYADEKINELLQINKSNDLINLSKCEIQNKFTEFNNFNYWKQPIYKINENEIEN
jgi:hypothetical protein